LNYKPVTEFMVLTFEAILFAGREYAGSKEAMQQCNKKAKTEVRSRSS